jgi:cyclopropane-fatty-acyl-phospholipid synthase
VSIGMFEHVGPKNYGVFMDVVRRCMKEDGLFLLHTIGSNNEMRAPDPWIEKYIFPGGVLPSVRQIGRAISGRFVMEDWQNLSVNYDRTLMAWHGNFVARWDELRPRYGDEFFRMWTYYLLSCAGAFRARYDQVWQVVLSKHGVEGGFRIERSRARSEPFARRPHSGKVTV